MRTNQILAIDNWLFLQDVVPVEVTASTGTYRAEPARIEEHGQSDHLHLQDAASAMCDAREEEMIAAAVPSRQLKTTREPLDPRPPPSPIGEHVVRHDGGRERSRGIADAVCITPSLGDYAASLTNQERPMGEPSPGQLPSSNVAQAVSSGFFLTKLLLSLYLL